MNPTERFARLFRGREKVYGQYLVDPDGNKIKTVREEIPRNAWERHLEGEGFGLGIVPINDDNECYFAAIDLDDTDADPFALAEKCKKLGLPLVACSSKSGGVHFYLFLRDPAPATLVVEKLRTWSKVLGLTNEDARPIEIFPKQTRLGPDSVGNWINLPYYGGTRLAVGPDATFLDDLDRFLAFAESSLVGSEELSAWTLDPGDDGDAFTDGPPCLQTLHVAGYPQGSRNNGLYNIAVYFKLSSGDDWKDKVRTYNSDRMDPPMSSQEVETVIGSMARRDYGYRGNDLPLYPYCCQGEASHLKSRCASRKYGCSAGSKSAAHDKIPELSNLRKIETEPPIYYLTVGGTDIKLSTEELMAFRKFRATVFESLNVFLPMVKENDWIQLIDPLLDDVTTISAPEDASVRGVFHAHVKEFLSYRRRADSAADILRGMPWEDDEGRVFFRATDLLVHLDDRRFRKWAPHEVYDALRKLGGDNDRLKVKGADVPVWWLPSPDAEQSEPFDTPERKDPDF